MHVGGNSKSEDIGWVRRLRRFSAREEGSSTIETVLWPPVFIGAFCLMADAAFIFNGQTIAMRTMQDANRNMSIGRLVTTDKVEDEVEPNLAISVALHASSAASAQLLASVPGPGER